MPPVAPAAAAPADTLVAAPSPLTQALTSVGLFDGPAVRGAKFFEEMALQHDSWGKINSHFKDIYHGSRDSRPQDIAKMAQRLGVAEAELKPLMEGLAKSNMISPLKIDLGVSELFFRRLGFAEGKKVIERLQTLLQNPQSRLNDFEKTKLASSLFRDLAVPGMIGQGGKGTCAAASLHVMTASSEPQKFLNTVLDLAEGKSVVLPDGKRLQPNDDWRDSRHEDRQLSEAVLQNAYMDLMLGPGVYHSHQDTGANAKAPSAGQQTRGLEKLSGNQLDYDDSSTVLIWPASSITASNSMGYLEDELARGRPVLVNVWGHAMAVVGMDKTGPEPKVLVSTYGAQIEMPASDLQDYILHSITVDDAGRDNKRIAAGQRVVIGTDLGRLPK